MAEINKKSLIMGIIFGFAAWFWAFIIVGSAFYDFATNKPIETPDFGLYVILLIANMIISIAIIALYIWKYEQKNLIYLEGWSIDAIILGTIICAMNFIMDALFFGVIMQRNLLAYYFLESTTGYMYPAIILITWLVAYLIYGKNE
ncbi:MAG: hypothetical protein ACTSR8_03135 [Promethearchaeota archaeon]